MCVHVCMSLCVSVCVCVCLRVCVYVYFVCVSICIFLYESAGADTGFCVRGGHIGMGMGACPPNLPGCLGKRSKHHHPRPKTLATGVLFLHFWKL